MHEAGERGRRGRAHCGLVNRLGGNQPQQKDRHQHQPQHDDRPERGRAEHPECVRPGDRHARFAAPAHLIEADCGEGADQRKPGGEREDQRQQVVAGCQPRQDETDQRIEHAEKNDIGAIRREIVETSGEDMSEVDHPDMPDSRWGRMQVFACSASDAACRLDSRGSMPELIDAPFDRIAYGHDRSSPNRWFEGRGPPVAARSAASGHERTATRL